MYLERHSRNQNHMLRSGGRSNFNAKSRQKAAGRLPLVRMHPMEVLTAGRLLHAACLPHISVSMPLKILTRQQRIIALVVRTHGFARL